MDRQISIVRERKEKISSHSNLLIHLCKNCYKRNFENENISLIKYFTNIKIKPDSNGNCFICKNFLQEKIPLIIDKINSELLESKQSITKIDIGTILHYQFYENEDYLRSMFQIRGKPNIKYEINSLLREKIKNSAACVIDHINPTIRFEIVIQNDLSFSILSKNKEFYLLGRYRKLSRGISQKDRTKKGNVTESDLENNVLENRDQTVESFVNEIMSGTYNMDSYKISWTGGEDKNSLVMGRGRPFLVKSNSYTFINKRKELFSGNGIEVEFEKIEPNDIDSIHRYKQVVRILLKLEKAPHMEVDLIDKVNCLVGRVQFVIKNKTITRRIYEAKIVATKNEEVELLLHMDNGIPIKQFIGGQDPINPCLSDVIQVRCECIYFDIIEFT